jgi:alpha-tubulin suppressor-like RCC1 family protein
VIIPQLIQYIGNESSFSVPQVVNIDYKEVGEKSSKVFGGSFHSMILTTHGNLYVFGCNTSGQLGLGDTHNRLTPTYLEYNALKEPQMNHNNIIEDGSEANDISERSNKVKWKSVACGAKHTLLLSTMGDLYRTGSEFIHPGCTTFDHFKTPQKICTSNQIIKIAAGKRLSMVLDSVGNVYVDDGGIEYTNSQLNDTKNRNVTEVLKNVHWNGPNFSLVTFEDMEDAKFVSIGCGEYHCLAIDCFGTVFSWGCTHFGKLARYGNPITPKPCSFLVDPATECVEVSGGSNHSFVLTKPCE